MTSMMEMADEMLGSTSADAHEDPDTHGVIDESQPTVMFKGLMALKKRGAVQSHPVQSHVAVSP